MSANDKFLSVIARVLAAEIERTEREDEAQLPQLLTDTVQALTKGPADEQ